MAPITPHALASTLHLDQAGYFSHLLEPSFRTRFIELGLERLRQPDVPAFDAVAGRGLSGAVGASTFGLLLDVPVLLVRKPADHSSPSGTHSFRDIEGPLLPGMRVLLVDDFAETGATIDAMRSLITKTGAEVVGVYFYRAFSVAQYQRTPEEADSRQGLLHTRLTGLWVGTPFAEETDQDAWLAEHIDRQPRETLLAHPPQSTLGLPVMTDAA